MNSLFLDQLQRPFIIFGMGLTGQSILRLLKSCSIENDDILIFDDKLHTALSKVDILKKKRGGTLIVSPGISLEDHFIQEYLSLGGHLSSELEIAFSFLDKEKVISITGSLGKSTTCALLYEAVKTADSNAFLGGNFGVPLAEYVTNCIEKKRAPAKFIILELSSYQLENFKNLKSDISVITYLTQNHMDRYFSLSDYYNTKLSLIHKTNGPTICNKNGGELFSYLSQRPFDKIFWTDRSDPLIEKEGLLTSKLIGHHNQDNIALAAKVIETLHLNGSAYSAIRNFSGLPHRFENIGTYCGITFINDSKATAIASVQEAIRNVHDFFQNRQVHILLGGRDKGLPWEKLNPFKCNPLLHFYFFGECGESAQRQSQLIGPAFKKLENLFPILKSKAKTGDVVILTPGGSSLDEFSNFEERGSFFKNEILKYWSC